MFYEESLFLMSVLEGLQLGAGKVVIDVGSSDRRFRTVQQPYIYRHVDRPLLDRRVRLVMADAKAQEGVDVVLDLTSEEERIRDELIGAADVVLCTNLLEHVTDRDAVCRRLARLLRAGGTLIVTVPHRYPEHLDPIDTLFRPSPEELRSLFDAVEPRLEVVAKTLLPIRHAVHYRGSGRWWRRYLPWARWALSAVVLRRPHPH